MTFRKVNYTDLYHKIGAELTCRVGRRVASQGPDLEPRHFEQDSGTRLESPFRYVLNPRFQGVHWGISYEVLELIP